MTADRIEEAEIPVALRPAMRALADAGARLAQSIRRGIIPPQSLERQARTLFQTALAGTGLRWLDSGDGAQELDPQGALAMALTPLDAAANVEIDLSMGTLFSLYPARDGAEASFLRCPGEQIAAGYIVYGPRCTMVATFGKGVQRYLLDGDGPCFRLVESAARIPGCAFEFAIDVANYRHWPRPVRAYIDDCLAGVDGPRQKNFNMRWLASLVADTHRILMHGGVFLHPGGDSKDKRSRLRLLHECAPIALLIEQAGGQATDLSEPILSLVPTDLRQRTPMVFGSTEKVARIAAYQDLPEPEVSALFGNRGLFRA
ncbi:class 1 fructose-bisphosphatase [Paracoccus aminovorans]|uniref:class 1 fructose-bisphosphatase n=1 Tax=Paracoccus aminovorans TaxID=34004 RepID=UPI002B25D444|nr:class 1 fructose-bisphosphatase [Paracoccus aminovorans]